MTVQAIIKNRRLELGLTLKDVAKALGVSEGTVSRYETGDIQNMGIDKIASLSKVLQCSPAYLMGWEDAPAAGSLSPAAGSPAGVSSPAAVSATSAAISAADASPAPDPLRAQLLSDYDRLNDEGRQRVVDYADDLVISGRYEKNILDKVL